jgi:hypothetical protein
MPADPYSTSPLFREWAAKDTEDLSILTLLSRDPHPDVRTEVAGNKKTPQHLLKKLATDPEENVVAAVAGNPSVAAADILVFAAHPSVKIRAGVAGNPNISLDLLTQFANEQEEPIQIQVAKNPATPPHILNSMYRNAVNKNVGSWIIGNPNLDDETLEAIGLSPDTDAYVQQTIALNPRTPSHVIAHLASSTEQWVRSAVTRRILQGQEVPFHVIAALASDDNEYIRTNMACYPHLTVELIDTLSRDPKGDVRASVAWNKATPPDILTRLANDKLKTVRKAAAENPNTPTDAQVDPEKLTPGEKGLAAVKAATTWEILEPMLDHKMLIVRARAALRSYELGFIALDELARRLNRETLSTQHVSNWFDEFEKENRHTENVFLEVAAAVGHDYRIRRLMVNGTTYNHQQIMWILDQKTFPMTIWHIAHNHTLTGEMLAKIAFAPEYSWPTSMTNTLELENLKNATVLPAGVLLYDDKIVRNPQLFAAAHPDTPEETIDLLRLSNSKHVKAALLRRNDVTLDDLKKAMKRKDDALRIAVAQHPLVTDEMLLQLAGDPNVKVRNAALAHPRATDDMKALAAVLGL